jgi:alpha-beta hydrolase superfamily lysophospholipase
MKLPWNGFLGRYWKRALRLAGVAIALWLLISLAVAYRLTHRSRRMFAEPAPAVGWGEFASHRLTTRDGQTIGAWFLQGRNDAPSVLLLHGNGGSRAQCLNIAEFLAPQGCTVLLISLRAHGDSSGEFNDIGYSARLDVIAAVEFLERHRSGKPIVVHGTSLGAAAAAFAAGELGGRAHGYVLECPYQDLKTAVRNRTENELPPILDWVAYQGLLSVDPLVLPDLEKISALSAVAGVPEDIPVLILAGGRDRRARLEEARAIHNRIRSHARLSIYEAADDLRLWDHEPARYQREVLEFIRDVECGFRARSGQSTLQ